VGVGSSEGRAALAARLREHRSDLDAAVTTRVHGFDDPRAVPDPAYGEGLGRALAASVDYLLAGWEGGDRRAPSLPTEVLAQARLDARDGVSLDTVTRRYVAVNALFNDAVFAAAADAGVAAADLRRTLGTQASRLDELLAAVGTEYERESHNLPVGVAERRRECVKRLLAGELADTSGLGYELDAEHIAVVARGDAGKELLRGVASRLDRRLLAVRREDEPVWAAWLGGRRPVPAEEVVVALRAVATDGGVAFALGEPAAGLDGWRFTHAQAKAALPLLSRHGPVVRFLDVALEAAIGRDELIATSLRRRYLDPLATARDGGEAARATLRAYFAAERNISATAAKLGVDRRTVRNRLAAAEQLLGGPLNGSGADMEIALRLDD
jgi:hypothetical protein